MANRSFQATLVLLASLALPSALSAPAQSAPTTPIKVEVHAAQSIGPYTPIWNYFGADEPNYLYAPNGKKLLGELAALSAAPVHFRAHNLFTSGDGKGSLKWGSTNVYTERPDGTPVYDFTITDRIFDALAAAHVRPIVEIGFMPEALSTHPQPYRHTFPKGDIFTGWTYPPKDEAKWSKLVAAYAAHLHERYGSQTDTWLWEVWNEPDIAYWHGTPAQYDRLYDITTAAIRQVLPNAKVGGPEATGVSDHSEPFLRQFLDHCDAWRQRRYRRHWRAARLHQLPPQRHPVFVDGHVVMSIATQLRAVERGMKVVAGYPRWRNTPIILGESDPEGCGACLSPQNAYRNGPLYAASVTEATMRTYELARKYGVTVEGAVTWAFEFEDQPPSPAFANLPPTASTSPCSTASGSWACSARNPGASWLATESSGALPLDQVVARSVSASPDVNAVATRNGSEVDVLLWNYHDADVTAPPPSCISSLTALQAAPPAPQPSASTQPTATPGTSGSRWAVLRSQRTAQHAQLQKAGALHQTMPVRTIPVRSGGATLSLTLPRQAVMLIRIGPASGQKMMN